MFEGFILDLGECIFLVSFVRSGAQNDELSQQIGIL